MKILVAAAAFAVAGAAMAQAADITAMIGHETKLDAHSSAFVYYTPARDGFHVVITTQQGRTSRAAIERFETVLAAGRSAAVSIPRDVGEAPLRMLLSNARDHLHIDEPDAPVAAR